MTNLIDAHTQWLTRPADKRFPDLESLYKYTRRRQQWSHYYKCSLASVDLTVTQDSEVALNRDTSPVPLTHWAFGQLATTVGAPAKYLRGLTPELVRECLSHGLKRTAGQCRVLIRSERTISERTIRDSQSPLRTAAFTGPTYGRIWDADVVEQLMEAVAGTGWRVPPARSSQGSESAGLYASDRDMFAFLVNDEKPIEIGNAKLGRGFFLWNSETGAATFGLTTFLYNYVCGNHIVWGAEQVDELKIIHRLKAPDRFCKVAIPMLNRFAGSRTLSNTVTSTILQAMDRRVGTSLEDVLGWFSQRPFSKSEVIAGYRSGEAEGDDVSTLWGMVQGLTASARGLEYTDTRVSLERRAGGLLSEAT